MLSTEYELRQLPLSLPLVRRRVEAFLATNGLRLDDVDYMAGISRIDDDALLACGALKGNIIKCVAVAAHMREDNLSLPLISHLISTATAAGHTTLRVFTKPANQPIFESMGFQLLAQAPKAILMENSRQPLNDYKHYLQQQRQSVGNDTPCGIIVMNANPFTRGHQYLISTAAQQVAHLFVVAVKEDRSAFPYRERLAMIEAGCRQLGNVTVLKGSDYQISAATFPSYFLKEVTDATDTHIALDLDLCCRHIAPALGATVRFVGSEPGDALTQRYNQLMHEHLPAQGIAVTEVPRCTDEGQQPVSASTVRRLLDTGHLQDAAKLVPHTTLPYLLAHLATKALQTELDLTPKPGLVDRHDSGAHTDMDYALMQQSIDILRPYFAEVARCAMGPDIDIAALQRIGRQGEAQMLQATHGINTHKGAVFALGLTVAAAAHLLHTHQPLHAVALQTTIARLARHIQPAAHTHGQQAVSRYNVSGALAQAQQGYPALFSTWLPWLQTHRHDDDSLHRVLLNIMSTLDDTNILHRCGPEAAQQVKAEAAQLFDHYSPSAMQDMNRRYVADNLSPGGAADMLALTVLIADMLG